MSTEESARVKALEQENRELRPRERDLKRACDFLWGGARPPAAQVVAFIDANRDNVVEGSRLGVEPIFKGLREAG